jgi:bifunctional polynucleotide phosphatase/kinase
MQVDRSASFYCGAAAGREKDVSCSDRLLAINLGLAFSTPEEAFLGHAVSAEFVVPTFDPRATIGKNEPLLEPSEAKLTSDKQEVSRKEYLQFYSNKANHYFRDLIQFTL